MVREKWGAARCQDRTPSLLGWSRAVSPCVKSMRHQTGGIPPGGGRPGVEPLGVTDWQNQ